MGASGERNRAVDLVKTAAICFVLISHMAAPAFVTGRIGSRYWLEALVWACFSHASVSLFLMASGALLLSPRRELTLRKLYGRNFLRLLTALLFWASCCQVLQLALDGALTLPALVHGAKKVLLFYHEGPLYYLHVMLLVYTFLPCTRLIVKHGTRRDLEYILALWFVLGILFPTVKTFWPFTLLRGIPLKWQMNMAYASIGYTLLGYYLTAYHPRPRRSLCLLALAAGVGITYGGTWAMSAAEGKPYEHFLEGMGAGIFLIAVGVYGLCASAPLNNRAGKAVEFLSKASFCVFLTHTVLLKLFPLWGLTVLEGSPMLRVPLFSLLLLTAGCLAYAGLSRIPVVNRYLI
ncbi:MAG: acyltransferase family protein [Oscillibacter sp.]|nr:acyltransferase family protein [Oscillibacter sp.]